MSRKKPVQRKHTAADMLWSVIMGSRKAGYRRAGPLRLRKCHKSRHGCLRYDQIERRRKLRRKGPRPVYRKVVEQQE